MEFQRERVYTALNADELKPGDRVIVAYNMYQLKEQVKMFTESVVNEIETIYDECYCNRFEVIHNENYPLPLAYLVERKENCTNCGCVHCWYREKHGIDEQRLHTCSKRIEPRAEKHYRPFRDTDELIKTWIAKRMITYPDLCLPHIWVRYKMNQCGQMGLLITKFEKNYVQIEGDMIAMHALMADYEFLDGSPCGVEE